MAEPESAGDASDATARKEWFAADGTRRRRDGLAASIHLFERRPWARASPEASPENPSPGHTKRSPTGTPRKPCAPSQYSRWEEETGSEASARQSPPRKRTLGISGRSSNLESMDRREISWAMPALESALPGWRRTPRKFPSAPRRTEDQATPAKSRTKWLNLPSHANERSQANGIAPAQLYACGPKCRRLRPVGTGCASARPSQPNSAG